MAKTTFRMPAGPVALCRRFLGPNGDLMVVSLLVSGAILAAVHMKVVSTRHERTFPAPVSVKSPNDEVAVAAFDPLSVQLTLRGSQDELSSVDPARLAVELFPDAKKIKGAEQSLNIRAKDVTGTGKLKLVSVEPSRIDVRYDIVAKWPMTGRIATPRLEGVPVQGSASVEMPTNLTVLVQGSKSKMEAFREKKILLPTSPINVEGKTESFDATVAILPPPDSGITKVEPATVTVHVDVQTVAAAGVAEDNAPLELVAPQSVPGLSALLSGEAPSSADTNAAPARTDAGAGEAEEAAPGEAAPGEYASAAGGAGAQNEIELPPPVEMPDPAAESGE